MTPLVILMVFVLMGLCVLFLIRRSRVEGFGAFQNESKRFADKQFTYFQDTAAKGIFTNSGLDLSQFNTAVKSPDLYVPTSLDRDYTSYFVEDPESAFSEKDKALCRGASHPRFLPPRERKSSVACGWWFVSDPTIPSVGVLGTRDGPVFRDMVGSGEWIWDMNHAAEKEDIKRCKMITSCDVMDIPGVLGECGFCESNGYAVPIDSSGRVKYPESETGSCGENTKNTADACSKPEAPPLTTDNGVFCGTAGRPSPDGRTRLYTVDECATLGGSLQAGGFCLRSDGGSFSEDCAPLNSPTYAASVLPPDICKPTAQGRLTKACLSSLVLSLGYGKAGSIYLLLNSSNPPNVTDREAIAVLQKAGLSIPDSILGSGAIDIKSAGTLYKKILDTTYSGATSQIKEAARWLTVGSDAFDVCDYAIGQPGPFGPNCLQRAFRAAGCQASGAMNPSQRTAPLYANMTWAEVNSKFTRLFEDTKATDADAQDAAMRDCLGISYLRGPMKLCDGAIAIKNLAAGMRIRMKTDVGSSIFLRHSGFMGYAQKDDKTALMTQDSTFTLSPPNNGMPGYFSFQSVNFPNHFLRHAGFRFYLHPKADNPVYKNDSSFKPIPALNGNPSMASLQSANFPDRYISTHPNAPDQVWLLPSAPGQPADLNRVSWVLMKPT